MYAPWVGTRAPGRASVRGEASVCMVSPTVALRVRYAVCGSWNPLALLGPVLGPWVCFDDLDLIRERPVGSATCYGSATGVVLRCSAHVAGPLHSNYTLTGIGRGRRVGIAGVLRVGIPNPSCFSEGFAFARVHSCSSDAA